MNLVSIGRFSKMTRLSIKALRRYDKLGLLVPARIDPSSGYRYYALEQANQAEAIRILRSVDMPLAEIRDVLNLDDPSMVHDRLVQHQQRLAERLATQERMLGYLETIIQRRKGIIMPYDVQIIATEPQKIAATRIQTSLRTIGADIGTGFGTLVKAMTHEGLTPAGAPLIVYHQVIDEETDGDLEIAVPISAPFQGNAAVHARTLEGGSMATTVHIGPYEEIAPAYHTLMGWISKHGHEIVGPPREIYLNDPQQVAPQDLQTRVEFPIA